MISFESDYIAGCHPEILRRLTETNLEVLSGYGADHYTESAREKIKAACQRPEAQVEFITGGTQTNSIVISTMLREHEGVISATTGHINAHEAGAIEYTGHKVIELPAKEGKLLAEPLAEYLELFYKDANHEHMVYPGMVYISHPTEYGTLYTKQELETLAEICRRYDMPLFLDGARLGYGLMSRQTDVTLPDIARLCDVFYIGGTKVGALCGEALVFTHGNRPAHFVNAIKKRGALVAKGRLLSVQFDTLFTNGLYFEAAKTAIDMAEKLKSILHAKQVPFFLESPTNQQFVILENSRMEELKQKVAFGFWETYDAAHTVVRFATSWSTTDEDLQALEQAL